MKIYIIERKKYPNFVRKMKFGDLPPNKLSPDVLSKGIRNMQEVFVKCDREGNLIERGKHNEYRLLSVDEYPVKDSFDTEEINITEMDMKVLDLWQAPNGNLFLKVDHEYSLAIGHWPNLGPNEWNPKQTSYVKANKVTPARKVGRLEVMFDKLER